MKVILGLGNFGLRYRRSRHNIGFAVVKKLARQNAIKIRQRVHKSLVGKGSLGGEELLLVLPLTFMNLSGEAVTSLVRGKRIGFGDLLVVLDDVNLPVGKIRIRADGSDGGHKGLRSIIKALGTQEFARLRIGVGRVQQEGLVKHVLGRFNKEESEIINKAQEQALSCCLVWAKDGIAVAMDRFN